MRLDRYQLSVIDSKFNYDGNFQLYYVMLNNDKYGIYQINGDTVTPTTVQFIDTGNGVYVVPAQPINVKLDGELTDELVMNVSIQQMNILHDISGLLNTTSPHTEAYKITSQIGYAFDIQAFKSQSTLLRSSKLIGRYIYNLPEGIEEFVYQPDIEWLDGVALLNRNDRYVLPVFSGHILKPVDCIPAGRIDKIPGQIVDYEPLFYIAQIESGTLYINIFGLHTGYTYKFIKVQDNVTQFYGLDYAGGTFIVMYETSDQHSELKWPTQTSQIGTYMKLINLANDTMSEYKVMYIQQKPKGVRFFGRLVFLLDDEQTVVLELVETDDSVYVDETGTLVLETKYPFKYISTQIESQLHTHVELLGTRNHTYEPLSVERTRLLLLEEHPLPTLIDSLQYVFGIDRIDEESPQKSFKYAYYTAKYGYDILSEQNKVGYEHLVPRIVRLKLFCSDDQVDENVTNRLVVDITRNELEQLISQLTMSGVINKPSTYDIDNTISVQLNFTPVLSIPQLTTLNQEEYDYIEQLISDKFVPISEKLQQFDGIVVANLPSIKQGTLAFIQHVQQGIQLYYNGIVYVPATQQIIVRGYRNE